MRLARFLLPLVIVLAFAGCAVLGDRLDDAPDEAPPEEVGVPPEEEREPALSVPEAYDAISLSVQAGDPDAAIAAYESAAVENPDDPATRVLLANLFLIAGEVEQAGAILDGVLIEEPENTDALFLVSLIRGLEGRVEAQRELLERILQIDPDEARARSSLAELLLQERSYSAAAANFEEAIASEPENLVARVGLGNVYLRQDRFEEAEAQLTAAIEIAPDYSFAYSDRARARAQQFELSGAESDLSQAIELDPDFYWHYIDRGRVRLEQRGFARAEADFARAIELNDERFIGFALRGRARDAQDEIESALSDYQETLRRRPDYYPVYAPVGIISYMLEDYETAFDFMDAAYNEERPQRITYGLLAAISLKSAGQDARAEEYAEALIAEVARGDLAYQVLRYYLQPANEAFVLNEVQRSDQRVVQGQMYFYVGAQLELLGRVRTAQSAYLQAEDLLQPVFPERRLASWRLQAYRSQEDSSGG